MEIYNMGFSTIRLSTNKNSYTYKYQPGINTFPEETYLHEFLHTLEKNAEDYGYSRPELHDYATYGYTDEGSAGIKQWYIDYMNCRILDKKTNKYVGLNPKIYSLKPAHESNFTYSIETDLEKEPQNLIEEIKTAFKAIKENIRRTE